MRPPRIPAALFLVAALLISARAQVKTGAAADAAASASAGTASLSVTALPPTIAAPLLGPVPAFNLTPAFSPNAALAPALAPAAVSAAAVSAAPAAVPAPAAAPAPAAVRAAAAALPLAGSGALQKTEGAAPAAIEAEAGAADRFWTGSALHSHALPPSIDASAPLSRPAQPLPRPEPKARTLNPALHPELPELQRKLEAMVEKLRLPKDGSAPYKVVIQDSLAVNAAVTFAPGVGPTVYVSLGMLSFVENDDELKFVLGHEMEHPGSDMQGVRRDLAARGEKAGDFQKRILAVEENEVDVKSAIFRVHRSGGNPYAAIDLFARLTGKSDSLSETHTMHSTRGNVLGMAVAAIQFELGEKTNTATTHELTDLAARIARSEALRAHAAEGFSDLLKVDLSPARKAAEPLLTGEPFDPKTQRAFMPGKYFDQNWGRLQALFPQMTSPLDVAGDAELRLQAAVRAPLLALAEEIVSARASGKPLSREEIYGVQMLLKARWTDQAQRATTIKQAFEEQWIDDWAQTAGQLDQSIAKLEKELPSETNAEKRTALESELRARRLKLARLEPKIERLRSLYDVTDGWVDKTLKEIRSDPEGMGPKLRALDGEWDARLLHVGPILKRAAELRLELDQFNATQNLLDELRQNPWTLWFALDVLEKLPLGQRAPLLAKAIGVVVDWIDAQARREPDPAERPSDELRRTVSALTDTIDKRWLSLRDDPALLERAIGAISRYPVPSADFGQAVLAGRMDTGNLFVPQWGRDQRFRLGSGVWSEVKARLERLMTALVEAKLRVDQVSSRLILRRQAEALADAALPAAKRDADLLALLSKNPLDDFEAIVFGKMRADRYLPPEKQAEYFRRAESGALEHYTKLLGAMGDASPAESARVLLTLTTRAHGARTGAPPADWAEVERAVKRWDGNPLFAGARHALLPVDRLIALYGGLPRPELLKRFHALSGYLDDRDNPLGETAPEGMSVEDYFRLKYELALSLVAGPNAKFSPASAVVKRGMLGEDEKLWGAQRELSKPYQFEILKLQFDRRWKEAAGLPGRARIDKTLDLFYDEARGLVLQDQTVYARLAKLFLDDDSDRLYFATRLIRMGRERENPSLTERIGVLTAAGSVDMMGSLAHVKTADLVDYFAASPLKAGKSYLASAERENVYKHIAERLIRGGAGDSAAMMDPELARTLYVASNRLELALWQLDRRHDLEAAAARTREPRARSNKQDVRPLLHKIMETVVAQFPEPSSARDELINRLEDKLQTNDAESKYLGGFRITLDNWYQNDALAFADLPSLLARVGFDSQYERLEFVKYLMGRRKTFPDAWRKKLADWKKTLAEGAKPGTSPLQELTVEFYEEYLQQAFLDAPVHARNLVLQEFLNETTGVLSEPAIAERVYEMILGEHAKDELYREPAMAYLNALEPSDRKVVIGHILASMTGAQQDRQVSWALKAMGPFGLKAGQAISSNGLEGDALKEEFEEFFDGALPPTRAKRLADLETAFGARARTFVLGDLMGSGSLNYVVEAFVPKGDGTLERVAVRIQRENAGGQIEVQNRVWKKAIDALTASPNPTLRGIAEVADEARLGAMETLGPGGAELDLGVERALYNGASQAYAEDAKGGALEIKVARPLPKYQKWVDPKLSSRVSVYEFVDGVGVGKIADAAKRRRAALRIVAKELRLLREARFDPDGHQGNWLYDQKADRLYRVDYAQFLRATPEARAEIDAFASFFQATLKPRLSDADVQALARSFNAVYAADIPAAELERDLRVVARDPDFPPLSEAANRMFFIRQKMEKMRGGGKIRFRQSTRRALHSIMRLRKYKDIVGEREFLGLLLAGFGLRASDYPVPWVIEQLPGPRGVKDALQRFNAWVRPPQAEPAVSRTPELTPE